MTSIETIKQNAKDFPPGILKEEDKDKFNNLVGKIVINLSYLKITEKQEKVLEKGLTFCPTPGKPDFSKIWLDFKEFHRKLELKKYFLDNPSDELPDIQRKLETTSPQQNIRNILQDGKQRSHQSKYEVQKTLQKQSR
jgi:hypothetical protein